MEEFHIESISLHKSVESNIRRRGEVGGSAKKIGKRIKELERLYEIEHGGSRRNNCVLKTQEQLAKEMDMDVRTLQNYKILADMIPEIDELVQIDIVNIESNLRQRVLGNTNLVKLGRCFSFLNNWYGFEHGGDRKSSEKVFNLISSDEPKTQKEFAESYGITQQTMNNYIRMASMIPELED